MPSPKLTIELNNPLAMLAIRTLRTSNPCYAKNFAHFATIEKWNRDKPLALPNLTNYIENLISLRKSVIAQKPLNISLTLNTIDLDETIRALQRMKRGLHIAFVEQAIIEKWKREERVLMAEFNTQQKLLKKAHKRHVTINRVQEEK